MRSFLVRDHITRRSTGVLEAALGLASIAAASTGEEVAAMHCWLAEVLPMNQHTVDVMKAILLRNQHLLLHDFRPAELKGKLWSGIQIECVVLAWLRDMDD